MNAFALSVVVFSAVALTCCGASLLPLAADYDAEVSNYPAVVAAVAAATAAAAACCASENIAPAATATRA